MSSRGNKFDKRRCCEDILFRYPKNYRISDIRLVVETDFFLNFARFDRIAIICEQTH